MYTYINIHTYTYIYICIYLYITHVYTCSNTRLRSSRSSVYSCTTRNSCCNRLTSPFGGLLGPTDNSEKSAIQPYHTGNSVASWLLKMVTYCIAHLRRCGDWKNQKSAMRSSYIYSQSCSELTFENLYPATYQQCHCWQPSVSVARHSAENYQKVSTLLNLLYEVTMQLSFWEISAGGDLGVPHGTFLEILKSRCEVISHSKFRSELTFAKVYPHGTLRDGIP